MSKRNKRKNKQHKSHQQHKPQAATVATAVSQSTSDEHQSDLSVHASTVPSTDTAHTTIAKADDVAPQAAPTAEKAAMLDVTEAETAVGSNRALWAFGWGLAIGAVIVSVFF